MGLILCSGGWIPYGSARTLGGTVWRMWEQVSITCASSHWLGCPVELEYSAKAEVAMSLLRTDL